MHIITIEEIRKMIEAIHPKFEVSNLIEIDDEDLKHYLFLHQYAQAILANSPFSYKEILYSQYYWFVYFKNQYFSMEGYDGGLDQQALLLIENVVNKLEGEVD
jgi:hypothetical protein